MYITSRGEESKVPLRLKPGARLFGAACDTEAIVVKAPPGQIDLRIGGHPALAEAKSRIGGLTVTTPSDAAPALGKRYVDAEGTLEILCTKAGGGAFAVGDNLCVMKDAKPLPASD